MARNKKAPKAKEPIRLRMKDLSNGNKSRFADPDLTDIGI